MTSPRRSRTLAQWQPRTPLWEALNSRMHCADSARTSARVVARHASERRCEHGADRATGSRSGPVSALARGPCLTEDQRTDDGWCLRHVLMVDVDDLER